MRVFDSAKTLGWRLVFQLAGMALGVGAVWFVMAAILSIFPAWLIVLATAGLAVYVFTRQSAEDRRLARVDAGRCGGCGYDLRATPDVCPECGRDSLLDEPAWRRLRRTYAEAASAGTPIVPTVDRPVPVLPINVVRKNPVDLGPIPLEDE